MANSKKKISYTSNLAKEVKQYAVSWSKTNEMSNKVGPGTDAKANKMAAKKNKDFGQLLGAVLQGRRYDDKTGKQIKKPTRAVTPKTGPLVKIAKNAKKTNGR
jgi:hypothetical protein